MLSTSLQIEMQSFDLNGKFIETNFAFLNMAKHHHSLENFAETMLI